MTVPTSEGNDFNDVAELMKAESTDANRVELLADALVSGRHIYRFGEPTRLPIH